MTQQSAVFNTTMLLGTAFAGLIGIIAALRRHIPDCPADRASLRLSLSFCIGAVLFAFAPDSLTAASVPLVIVWRLTSLLLAGFLAYQIMRAVRYARTFDMRFPRTMIFLLVVSAFFVTIELGNSLVWSAPAPYVLGVLWLTVLAGVQFVAFATYDHSRPDSGAVRGDPARGRLRRDRAAGDSDRAPQPHADADDNHHADARGNRTDRRPDDGRPRVDQRPVADAALRPDAHAVRHADGQQSWPARP
jgi:hypothetical protein